MQATCSSCSNVVTVDEKNPKLPEGPFSVKCPKCQTPVRFPGRGAAAAKPAAKPAAAAASAAPAPPPAPRAAPSIPLKPTALPGERALVALDDQPRAAEMAHCLGLLGYEVDIVSDADGVRQLEQAAHVIVVMARTVAEGAALTCYQRLFLLNADLRRAFFLILVGDEYTTGDGVQAFVVHGDLVIASPDAGSCEATIRDRLIERGRLFRVFIDCKRKNEVVG
jgi:hypothetical protein